MGQGEAPKPYSHVYGENGVEIIVYNMKRNPKKEKRTKKKQRKRKV